jgi:branched-chain amino acid transport system permease protein
MDRRLEPKTIYGLKLVGLLGLGLAVVAIGYGIPAVVPPFHLEPLALGLIYVIIALGLNIVNGQAGQFSIGHAAFAGIGAYTAGGLSTMVAPRVFHWQPNTPPDLDSPGVILFFMGSLLAGGIVAAFFGYLVGIPTLRLRGDYLAIATLGFGEIMRVILENTPALGGPLGLHDIPKFSTYPVIGVAVVLTILLCRNIATSVPGRCFVALREDEIAAESLGIATTKVKVNAMALSAGIAGIGGGLLAHRLGSYMPVDLNWIKSVEFVLMVVLGGSGSITGTTLAAIVLGMLPHEMLQLTKFPWLQKLIGNKMVVYSVLLIVMMLVRSLWLKGSWELSFEWMRQVGRKVRDLWTRYRGRGEGSADGE